MLAHVTLTFQVKLISTTYFKSQHCTFVVSFRCKLVGVLLLYINKWEFFLALTFDL